MNIKVQAAMIAPKRSISSNRGIAVALAILAALTALKFGFFILALGLFYGVVASVLCAYWADGDALPLVLGVLAIVAGAALWIHSGVIALQRGLPPFLMSGLQALVEFPDSLPIIAMVTMVAGAFLVLARLITKLAVFESTKI